MSANQQQRRTPRGHVHAEAFCLMHYECKDCRHHEVIWNSRDGVTPFGTSCPSCGGAHLLHAYFGSDKYAPDHKPHQQAKKYWSSQRSTAWSIRIRNA